MFDKPTLKLLIEKRAELWLASQEILKRSKQPGFTHFSTEETRTLDKAEAEIGPMSEEIERLIALTRINADTSGGNMQIESTPETRAFDRWIRTGDASELRSLGASPATIPDAEVRALGVGTGSAGGFTVPESFRRKIVETLKAFGGIRAVADVLTTSNGQELPWPSNDDTANVGAILAENTVAGEQDLELGQKKLTAHMYTSKIVKVSFQLLEDNDVQLESYLARKLGERIARAQSPHFTTGTGTGQPEGAQTNATVGKTGATGQVATIIYDDLVDLVHSVDAAYREDAVSCVWQMADGTFAKVRKLKDADGRPLVEPDLQRGVPNTLLGYRVVVNNDMPAMAASAKPILFGNFKAGYVIRDVNDVRLLQLRERYADALQVGFLAFLRSDGLVQDSAAIRAYQNSAT